MSLLDVLHDRLVVDVASNGDVTGYRVVLHTSLTATLHVGSLHRALCRPPFSQILSGRALS